MQNKTSRAIIIAGCLALITLGIAFAQQKSPLAGIPHMSTEPDGPETQKFPAGVEKVYLVFDYDTEEPVEIVAEIRSEAQQGAVIFNNRETYSGSGTANIEIPGPGSSAFADGVYDTIIRFRAAEGQERTLNVTAGWEWTVGAVELPESDPSNAQVPLSRPPSDAQTDLQLSSSSDASINASPSIQSATPPSSPGISPIILIGVGIIVVILLAIIAWAVRGFMTTA